jgi:hypothetical protein
MKHRITFTDEEIRYLENILNHFSDYIAKDDRYDHGIARLNEYREFPIDKKRIIYRMAGRLKYLCYRYKYKRK